VFRVSIFIFYFSLLFHCSIFFYIHVSCLTVYVYYVYFMYDFLNNNNNNNNNKHQDI